IAKVKLSLEPQPIIVHAWRVRQGQVTPAQNDMGAGLGTQVRLHEENNMQGLRALLREHLHLVYTGPYMPLHGGLFEVLRWDVVVMDLTAVLALGASHA